MWFTELRPKTTGIRFASFKLLATLKIVVSEFASAKERLLTAPAMGKVAEILIRPGTKITPETVILLLSNPKLVQEVNQSKGLLAQQQAQREAFKYEQQNLRLNYQGRIADIEAEIEKKVNGFPQTQYIQSDFIGSSEYKTICTLGEQIQDMLTEGAYVKRGDKVIEISSFKQAIGN